jgi:hypothetical protein
MMGLRPQPEVRFQTLLAFLPLTATQLGTTPPQIRHMLGFRRPALLQQ